MVKSVLTILLGLILIALTIVLPKDNGERTRRGIVIGKIVQSEPERTRGRPSLRTKYYLVTVVDGEQFNIEVDSDVWAKSRSNDAVEYVKKNHGRLTAAMQLLGASIVLYLLLLIFLCGRYIYIRCSR